VRELVAAAEPKPSWVIVRAETWSYVDATATAVLAQLHDDLARQGITLGVARAKGRLRDIFDATGLTAVIGSEYLFPTVRAAVKAFGERADGDTAA
jgi:MFS superfamily sulfate permease-like transporter